MESRRQLLFAPLAVLAFFLLCAPLGAQGTGADDLEPEALLKLESLLRRLGFAPGPVDGEIDEATLAAIARYQAFSFREGPAEVSRALLLELRGVAEALAPAEPAPEPLREPAQELPEEQAEESAPESAPESAVLSDSAIETAAQGTIEPENQPGLKTLSELETLADPDLPADPEPQVPTEPVLETAAAPEAAVLVDDEAEDAVEDGADDGLSPRTREILDGYQDDLAAGRRDPQPLARELNRAGRGAFEGADYEEAIALFSAAIALDPEFAAAYHNRGAARQAAGRTTAAAADFEAAFTRGWNRLNLEE